MSHSKGLAYTNRHGVVYYLCAAKTKTGKIRYVMARQPVGEPLPAVPAGYEIVESINSVVSVRKYVPPLITEAERQAVLAALAQDPALASYRAEILEDAVVVFEPQGGGDVVAMANLLGIPPSVLATAYAHRRVRYEPVLRFKLLDRQTRRFAVQRMCYRGGYEGWHALLSTKAAGDVGTLAARFCCHLGQESFFDLW